MAGRTGAVSTAKMIKANADRAKIKGINQYFFLDMMYFMMSLMNSIRFPLYQNGCLK